MNTSIQSIGSSSQIIVASDDNIPRDYRERARWFHEEYWKTMQYHLANLLRFCWHLKPDQVISFSSITPDGFVHAQYGSYAIYFPAAKLTRKLTPVAWRNQYELEIDNSVVPAHTKIELAQIPKNDTHIQMSTVGSRVMDTLLPWNLVKKEIQREDHKRRITSQNAIINKIIRIKSKNIASE